MTKQSQKGGDQSTNFQAGQMVVNVGIDEKRAREICHEMHLQLRRDYTVEAFDIAIARVTMLEEYLMSKMALFDGSLKAFEDPSFQLLLAAAQKTAASTERPADYDLLSELLVHRFEKGDSRIARAGISLAVDIVDKISDESLLGLTVAHAVTSIQPTSGDISQGLDDLNDLFGKILYGKLPTGNEWLDHLDILNTIRLSSFGTLSKVEQHYPEILSGYIDVGIEKSSQNHRKAMEILDANGLPGDLLVDHSLNPNYLRIAVPNKKQINSLSLIEQVLPDGLIAAGPVRLTKNKIKAINSIYKLYSKNATLKQRNITSFIKEWDNRPNLKVLRNWWDNMPFAFTITSVGKVLAHANAQRCDKNLPPIN